MADDTVYTVVDGNDTTVGSASSSFYEKNTVYADIPYDTAVLDNLVVEGEANADAAQAAAEAAAVSASAAAASALTVATSNKYISIKAFGAVGDGIADDAAAIQNAIDYAGASSTTKTVLFNLNHIRIASTISNPYSNVFLQGLGGDQNHTVDQGGQAGTKITWGGAAGGIMCQLIANPTASQESAGGGIEGMFFDCNSTAGVGLKVSSRHNARIDDVGVLEATTAGFMFTANAVSGTNYSMQFCQGGRLWFRQILNDVPGVLFTGLTSPLAGASFNCFKGIDGIIRNGSGVKFETGDNNILESVRIYRPSGTGYSVEFCGSNTSGYQCIDNTVIALSSTAPAIYRGTASYTYASANNSLHQLDRSNGTPTPILEAGATGSTWGWTDGLCSSVVISHDSVGTDARNITAGGNAQFTVQGSTDAAKLVSVGYDTTNNFGYLQATRYGTANVPLKLQPNGGDVYLGSSSLALGSNKAVAISNTLTFTGTDGSSVAFGAGGSVLYGNQTVTLSGDVSGSGSTAITTVIGAGKVTSAMLNADVFSTAHSWGGQQTFTAPILGTPASGNGTNITNVNAATLGGATFAAPGNIGTTTPGTAAFTTVSAATSITATDSNSLTALNVRSGGSTNYATMSWGRTSSEGRLGVVGSGGQFFTGTAGGDSVLQTDNNLWIGVGSLNPVRLTTTGNVVLAPAAVATTATDGFVYIETCAGTPTGVPTSFSGHVPMVYDTTNNKLYIYNGAWKSVTLT